MKTHRFGNMLSASPQMASIFNLAQRAAQVPIPISITGESGTGKSFLAQAIHDESERRNQEFIAENCAAIPENLLESELFGYTQGAFTGAIKERRGLLELAHRGTLFLDEIGDMPLSMQVKLLRVLESGKIRPLGAREWREVDVRIISATHRCLEELVRQRAFREDLLYRLRVVVLEIPPLRERVEDIAALVGHFLREMPQARRSGISSITPRALEVLTRCEWPGNVRQLRHEVERIVALKSTSGPIVPADISAELTTAGGHLHIAAELPLKEATRRFEHNYICRTIRHTNGNKTQAAELLGISRRSLYNKLGEQRGPETTKFMAELTSTN